MQTQENPKFDLKMERVKSYIKRKDFLKSRPSPWRAWLLKSTLWMASALVAVAVSGAQAMAATFGYVANLGDNTVSVITSATNTVVATVPVGQESLEVAITPDGARAHEKGL
jgi:YVTN family beta-propeller protein